MNWNEKKMYSNRLKRDFFFSILFIEATMQISQDHTMQPEVHCFEVVLFFFLPHLLDCNFLY